MNNPEKKNATRKNLMTGVSEQKLQSDLVEANKKAGEALRAIGEGAGVSSDWHDNFPFEQANRDFELCSSMIAAIKRQLENREIIKPRENTEEVGIGNQVVVILEGEKSPETFTILGVSDATMKSDWISYESPLGSSLMGKKVGDVVDFFVGETVRHVKIVEIKRGDGF